MPRIDARLSQFEQQLLRHLATSQSQAALHSLRIATGKRVSQPSHDPAAYFQVTALESRLSQVDQTINQVTAAGSLAAEAQLTVDLVRTQLETIREKLIEDEAGALSSTERAANQVAVDDALESIDSLAATRFTGDAAFSGASNYRVAGRDSGEITRVDVHRASSVTLSGQVTTAAQQATLTYAGAAGNTTAAATLTLAGDRGSVAIAVTSGQTLASLAETINAQSHNTGVIAEASGNTLTFTSVAYGSSAEVDVEVVSGTFALAGGDGSGRDVGVDAVAEINGQTTTGDGNRVTFIDNSTHAVVEFAGGFSGSFDSVWIEDDTALKFALSTDVSRSNTLGLRSLFAAELGADSGRLSDLASGRSLAGLGSGTSQAIRVVDEALEQLDIVQATVDSFADITVATSAALLSDMSATLQDTLTSINGVDVDEENAYIAYYQSLSSNAISSMALVAQQRQGVVLLLRSLAGLS